MAMRENPREPWKCYPRALDTVNWNQFKNRTAEGLVNRKKQIHMDRDTGGLTKHQVESYLVQIEDRFPAENIDWLAPKANRMTTEQLTTTQGVSI